MAGTPRMETPGGATSDRLNSLIPKAASASGFLVIFVVPCSGKQLSGLREQSAVLFGTGIFGFTQGPYYCYCKSPAENYSHADYLTCRLFDLQFCTAGGA